MSIILPLQAEINLPVPMKHEIVIVSGGRAPKSDWLCSITKNRTIWCIDHGIDCCRSAGLVPAHLIGDNDSSDTDNWKWAEKNGAEIHLFPPEKDKTDTQLALDLADSKSVILTGAFGGRFDHLFSIIHSFASANINGIISDDKEMLIPLKGPASLSLKFLSEPLAFSLLPLTAICESITTDGLKWPLKNASLSQAFPYAVSNKIKKGADTVSVSVNNGILGIYAYWD